MSGINQEMVVLTINKIKVEFNDSIGNYKTIIATGFWVENNEGKELFITNKHNLDPKLKLGDSTDFKLNKIEIELRESDGSKNFFKKTQFFEIDKSKTSKISFHKNADCVGITTPIYTKETGNFSHETLPKEVLADNYFHKKNMSMMDAASFVGFPFDLYDQDWNFPISRSGFISSIPEHPFVHKDLKTNDITLFNGFSLAGNSGSPIFLHEKGIDAGEGLICRGYVPAKLIGIMSGHWWSDGPEYSLGHTGLSYYTRSTSILDIL